MARSGGGGEENKLVPPRHFCEGSCQKNSSLSNTYILPVLTTAKMAEKSPSHFPMNENK